MNKPNLVLIGAGGHSHACIDVIEQHNDFQIVGLVGRVEEKGSQHLGYEVIASDEDLPQLARDYPCAIITTGQIKTPNLRQKLFELALESGFELPVIISPRAYVSPHASIGAGSMILHGAIVNSGAKVGTNCIINSRALVEHDAVVGDHCHVSTGATLNGGVEVGAASFIGSGSIVKEGISLGKRCVVGMGLSVRHDQADDSRFVGK